MDEILQKAKELGMNSTHYVNPHGYHDENHYTTAHDMAIIAQKAMEIPKFAEIVSTTSLKIPPTNKYKEERIFSWRIPPLRFSYNYYIVLQWIVK